jgi:Ca-activated chloride channel family protein
LERETKEVPPKTAPLVTRAPVSATNTPSKAVSVLLDVIVVDAQNKPVTDLQQSNFRVRENGQAQTLTSFTRERLPISIELLVDTSGSIAGKLKKIEAAGASIIRQCQPGDEFAVIEFKGSPNLVQDFTTEPSEAVSALGRLRAGGETALLDAAKLAVEHANSRAKNQRKAVVLITDGDERNSRCGREEVLNVLREANVQVYAIGFPDGLPEITAVRQSHLSGRQGSGESQAKVLLDELALVSGGRAFYPRSSEELDGIAAVISTDLRTQYRIGFFTTARPTNEWREVKVEVEREGQNLKTRSRSGYVIPKMP